MAPPFFVPCGTGGLHSPTPARVHALRIFVIFWKDVAASAFGTHIIRYFIIRCPHVSMFVSGTGSSGRLPVDRHLSLPRRRLPPRPQSRHRRLHVCRAGAACPPVR